MFKCTKVMYNTSGRGRMRSVSEELSCKFNEKI